MPYFITEENLEQFPTVDNRYVEMPTAEGLVQQLALGDLHGSALKALRFLLKYNIVQMEENDFNEFVRIFKALHKLADKSPDFNFTVDEIKKIGADLVLLDKILNSIICNHPAAKTLIETLFIGDDLGDRAGCDVITLIKFFILDNLGLEFRVLHSNHTAAFLSVASGGFPLKPIGLPFQTALTIGEKPNHPLFGQDRSLQNLGILLREKLFDPNQLDRLITKYLTHYRLFDFSLSENGKTFVFQTHADNELSIIWHAANRLLKTKQQLSGEDEKTIIDSLNEIEKIAPLLQALERLFDLCKINPENSLQIENLSLALAYAMNKINAAFYEFVSSGLFPLLSDPFKNDQNIDLISNPIAFIAWNRNTSNLFRPVQLGGSEIYYFHGHTDSKSPHDHVINLDENNVIGRTRTKIVNKEAVGQSLVHHGNFPHYHLPDQLSRQRINQLFAAFNVDEFVRHLTAQINTDIEQEKTIENSDVVEEVENTPPISNEVVDDDTNPLKRSSTEKDPNSKRLKFTIEATGQPPQRLE